MTRLCSFLTMVAFMGTVAVQAAPITIMDWSFDSSEGWQGGDVQELLDAGWTTTGDSTNFQVRPTTYGGVLTVGHSGYGQPTASYAFGVGLISGTLSFRAGVEGANEQRGYVSLRSGGDLLTGVVLNNPGSGTAYGTAYGVSGTGFTGPAWPGWFAGACQDNLFQIDWEVNLDGSNGRARITHQYLDNDPVVLIDWEPFNANRIGVPDSVHVQAGWSTATNKILNLNELSIVGIPEPASVLLLGLGCLGIFLVRRRS